MIVKAADSGEYSEIDDLLYEAFGRSEIERHIVSVTTKEDPNFQKGDLRVAGVDGKIVSMMMLIRRPLRIGTGIVNGAIVAPVATHPDYQRKGYCSAVMRDAVQYMKAQGFDITILWGIPWLYPHYGYSPAIVRTEIVLKPKQEGSEEENPCVLKSFSENDLGQMSHIYHSNTATRTCAEVRSSKMWEWKPGGSGAKLEVLEDRKGKVIGYRSLGTEWGGRPCAHEVGVLNEEACESIFNSLLQTARQKGLKEFPCVIHPDHLFSRFAFWHGGEVGIRSGGGAGMAQVLNLTSLLAKMKKELDHRLHCSEFHKSECTLKISSHEESVSLEISRGKVSVDTSNRDPDYRLDIPLLDLNPLITGYKSIQELVKNPQVKVKGGRKALRVAEVLFPAGFPSGGNLPLTWE